MKDEYKLFSLNKFRVTKENSYMTKNNCLKHISGWAQKKPHITNPKFNKFDQSYYHAGDEEDIKKYGLLPLRYVYSKELNNNKKNELNNNNKKNELNNNKNKMFKLYKNINYSSVFNTFYYIFNKFKKGIFIIIKDNKLITFLPFSNAYYINNWYKYTYFSKDEKKILETKNYETIKKELNQSILDFQNQHPEQYKYRKIDFNRKKWYANNCIFRNLFPNYEGELNTNIIKDMFETLIKERNIPDVEFFVNDRDFPILKKNLTEPYEHIFNSNNIPIEKIYQKKNMCPIFSKSITDEYADILLPTNDDWLLVSNKFFTNDCKNSYRKNAMDLLNRNWKTKKEICIFRGSATGCGITLETNMRLKAADLSMDYPDILDAGITDWNARMKKYKKEPIQIIQKDHFRFKLVNKIDNREKSNYKYILNIDGNVSAFRLSSELNMNSVLLIVTSDYKLWFSNKLEPYVHYIPIKKDLSDLIKQIEWCKKNDKICEKIAKNAMIFYKKYICKEGIFDYLEEKLININKNRDKNLLNIKFSNKKIAIISCFRDQGNGSRENERLKFIQLMNVILKPYFKFHIYIIEQSQEENFNIGKLKNIGFKIASQKKYDHYIFSDIDTIPDYDLIPYFLKNENYPISLASRGTRYEEKNKIINKPFLGALLGFNKKLFEEINGYPNNFWGWGGEDDALINRLININKNYICIPKKGSIIDLEEKDNKPVSIKNKFKLEVKDQLKYEKLYIDLTQWMNNGLNSLEYNILNQIIINESTTQIVVDLMKKKDMEKNPLLYPKEINNYNSLKKKISNSWKKLKKIYI